MTQAKQEKEELAQKIKEHEEHILLKKKEQVKKVKIKSTKVFQEVAHFEQILRNDEFNSKSEKVVMDYD